MTSEEVAILIVLYIFTLTIVILAVKLWLSRRRIHDLLGKANNPMSAVETKPIIPIMFDQKKSVPKASDASVPTSAPTTIAAPILYKIMSTPTNRIIERLRTLCQSIKSRTQGDT
jgi:hypothetical protein